MTKPTFFNQPQANSSGKDSPDALARRKEALRKKLRRAFAVAVALPVAAFSAHHIIENKDPQTNLEKPGIVLTLKEIFDQKVIARQGEQIASQQRLEKIQAKMARTEMGREMLLYIKEHKVKVRYYDPSNKEDQERLKDGTLGTYHSDKKEIRLNPHSPDDAIMVTLAHETRHAWQSHKINYNKLESSASSPEKKLLVRRYIEADAFAYQTTFALDFESKTGERLLLGRSLQADDSYMSTDAEMRDRLRQDILDGLPPVKARLNILKLGFETLQDRGYDKNNIEKLHKSVNALFEKILPQNTGLSEEEKREALWNTLEQERKGPDWKTMIKHLRKFGNMGLHDNDENYLANVPDQDIISLKWMGGLSDVRAPEFETIKSKYAAIVKNSESMFSNDTPTGPSEAPPTPPKGAKP